MNVFDIIIAVILLFAAVRGFMKGLFSEVASLVAIVAGVFCAIHFSYYVEYFLNDSVLKWSHQTNKIVAFAVTFLAVVGMVYCTVCLSGSRVQEPINSPVSVFEI